MIKWNKTFFLIYVIYTNPKSFRNELNAMHVTKLFSTPQNVFFDIVFMHYCQVQQFSQN
jgi:hypothetical protein